MGNLNKNIIPTEFKQTELGLIPKEWNVETIKQMASITTGSKNTQDRISDGLYPFFVRSQNIERINSYSFDGEAVLTAGDGVGTGKVFHYVNGKFNIHQRVYKISDFKNNLNGYFFFLYFSNHFYKRIMQMTAKSSVDSVRMEMIADMQIPIPPKTEQNHIATALSDADALITSLEKLIQKKRAIKQCAMQQLLKPKEGWAVKKLGEVLDYEQPSNYIVKDTEYNDNNQIPVLTAGKSFILGYTHEEFNRFENVPVIIFDDFTTATKFVDFPFKVKSSAMKILKPKHSDVNLRLVFEIMQRIDYPMGIGDHKRHWIADYQKIEIKTPSTSEEQGNISTILSDMDSEILIMETKLEKQKMIKQGMMQNLLTGKIRLI